MTFYFEELMVFTKNSGNVLSVGVVSLILLLGSVSVQAMSLSTYRIYLDNDNSTASFMMFNKEAVSQTCRLDLVHNNFDDNGKMSKGVSGVIPENSAIPWVRFSPKNFTAAALSSQTVRFTLRRKANTQAAEYRSYLEVFCDNDETEVAKSKFDVEKPTVSIKPRLVQNVPVIARTGKLEAQLSISDFRTENEKLIFILNRQGNRSLYGTLQLIDKTNGKVINYKKNISIYTETKQLEQNLTPGGTALHQLAVRFVEDERYGGSITYQQDVVLN
jgi:hypothetical protein